MTAPWRAHGAARLAAGFGEGAADPPELAPLSREALVRADVAPEEAHLAWELARLAPGLAPEDRRALEALALLVTEALARGSTRVARADLAERAAEVLADRALGAYLARRLDEGAFAGLAGEDRPLVIEGGFVTSERVRAVERALVARVEALACSPTPAGASTGARDALARVLARPSVTPRGPVVLTAEQRGAVELALTHRFVMISGGPGTGKTSIVVTLLRAAMARGDLAPSAIALAAPTGKAAERMRGAIEPALATIEDALPTDRALLDGLPRPRTIHRLLGWSPSARRFRHHEASPLSERLVVLDEGSMIDLFLMERVLACLGRDAQLVLLGDADQLPSVAAGAVFRDLAARAPSVRLTHSHRVDPSQPEGSHILEVAARVNRGELPPMDGPGVFLRDAAPDARQRFLREWLERARLGEPARRTFVRDADGWREPERLDALFTRAQERALLCVTRHGWRPTSVEAVNAWAHRELAGEPRWVAGEPVMVTENDYEHGLFNGDRGLLLWVAPDAGSTPRLCAVFRREERFAAFPLDAIRGVLELAWATTVHKAQGSEHDEIVLLLPSEDHPRLCTREVVYTAITRARRRVDVVADPTLLARSIRRRVERTTGLAGE
ncbi:MAG: AAA family ATPase [Sandaracinaceae bacterium]|nr:AAA family ATPase [Sandaracinaceae bacterium]